MSNFTRTKRGKLKSPERVLSVKLGDCIAQLIAFLLCSQRPQVWFSAFQRNFPLDVAKIYWQHCLEHWTEQRQWQCQSNPSCADDIVKPLSNVLSSAVNKSRQHQEEKLFPKVKRKTLVPQFPLFASNAVASSKTILESILWVLCKLVFSSLWIQVLFKVTCNHLFSRI